MNVDTTSERTHAPSTVLASDERNARPPEAGRPLLVAAFTLVAFLATPSGWASAQECARGDVSGCRAAGDALASAATPDLPGAFALYLRGCEGGDEASCESLRAAVEAHPERRVGSRTFDRVVLRGCRGESASMCALLAHDFVDAVGRVRGNARARRAIVGACGRDQTAACTAVAVMDDAGIGRRADPAAARAGFERGCAEGEGRACGQLGRMVESGRGGPADAGRARELHARGCALGDARSCGARGIALASTDRAAALPLLSRGCESGDGDSCLALGRLHEANGAAGGVAAARAYGEACETGLEEACGRLGQMRVADGDVAAGEPLLRAACRARYAPSCTDLGVALSTRGGARRAASYFRRACAAGDARGCARFGEALRAGAGVPRNVTRGAELTARACALGERSACPPGVTAEATATSPTEVVVAPTTGLVTVTPPTPEAEAVTAAATASPSVQATDAELVVTQRRLEVELARVTEQATRDAAEAERRHAAEVRSLTETRAEAEAEARRYAEQARRAEAAAAQAAEEAARRRAAEESASNDRARAEREASARREAERRAEAERARAAEAEAQRLVATQRAADAERRRAAAEVAAARIAAERAAEVERQREAIAAQQRAAAAEAARRGEAEAERRAAAEAARRGEERRVAEERRQAEQRAREASRAEERRQAEERRVAEERRQAEERRVAEERRQAERRAREALAAEQRRIAEQERELAAERRRAEAEAARWQEERARAEQELARAEAEAERRRAAERAAASDRARAEREAEARRQAEARMAAERARADEANRHAEEAVRAEAAARAREQEMARAREAAEAEHRSAMEAASRAAEERGAALGAEVRQRDEAARPAEPFARACEQGAAEACGEGATLVERAALAQDGGEAAPRERLLAGACADGDASACRAAYDALAAVDAPAAAEAARRGCELGDESACSSAGDALASGRGAATDRAAALAAYARACTAESSASCGGVHALCHVGYLPACETLVSACAAGVPDACVPTTRAVPEHATPMAEDGELVAGLDAMRDRGDDARAVARLRSALRTGATPRLRAALGLALQGLGRYVAAETLLLEALETHDDAWVEAHRAGLTIAMAHASRELGWVVVHCTTAETEVAIVADEAPPPSRCGRPLRLPRGEVVVELRAPGRRSERLVLHVADAPIESDVALAPFVCEAPQQMHTGGEEGGCCWPGQAWDVVGRACRGAPACPEGTASDGVTCLPAREPRPSRLATFHVGLHGGATNFVTFDDSVFRPTFRDGTGSGDLSIGPRVELRAGGRLAGRFGYDLVLGGATQGTNGWRDCDPTVSGCGSLVATDSYQLDVGVLASVHTAPVRRAGAFDFHAALGVRPYAHLRLGASGFAEGPNQLTAVTLPLELGVDLHLARALSLGLVATGDLWLPWKYCGPTPSGRSCSGFSDLEAEVSWSALLGLTVHVGD